MTLKQNPLLDLYNEGKAYEQSTKGVEIDIRGKKVSFTIRPESYESHVQFATDAGENMAAAMLNQVIDHTMELSEVSHEELGEAGASIHEFAARLLGKNGVTQLFTHIQNFGAEAAEKFEKGVFETAENVKN